VSKVPTLNQVIREYGEHDLSSGAKVVPCLEGPTTIFRKFIEKIRIEQSKTAKQGQEKSMEF